MNCKPGDLALVIGPSGMPCVGKVVKCLKWYAKGIRIHAADRDFCVTTTQDGWITDTELYSPPLFPDLGEFNNATGEIWLMPIRPLPGEPMTDITEQPIKSGERA